MTEKRFQLNKDLEWWFVKDNTIKVNEFGYRDDVIGEDKYRGLKQELTEEETVDLLNEQQATIESLEKEKVELMEDCACQYRRIQKLESEKEELEISINLFEADIIEKDNTIKRLQNQLDFIQNNISNAIQHKKTELEQKALKEIISDYNEFLLGHKGAE